MSAIIHLVIMVRKSIITALFVGLIGSATPVLAQTCDITLEEITRLRAPAFDNYTKWDETFGNDGMEQFSDLFPVVDGSIVAVGAYTKNEEDPVYKPLLVHMNEKGEVKWETREESKSFKSINRIIAFNKGYAVLGDLNDNSRGDGLFVAFYGDDGKRKNEFTIFESGKNLDGKAILASADGKSLMIAAQVNPGGSTDGQYGVLYKYTSSGKRVWRHGYSPGTRSVFHNLSPAKRGGYIVSGEVELPDGRMGGWLIRVDNDGAIMWQRSYSRGSYAAFLNATSLEDDAILLTGQTRPSGGKRNSGWIMKVKNTGDIVWQRYYAGDYNYSIRDVMPYEDGRSVALLAGLPRTLAERMHVRLLMFDTRGNLLNVEEFSEGQGAQGFTLREGFQGERIIAGYTQIKYSGADSVNEIPISTYNGWIAAAPALDPYEDPCLPQGFDP